MSIPPWADQQLSQDLPEIRARGEGQNMEFKREFPEQVSDLAKEIAAFATSNTGTVLLGVEDNGDIVGLESMEGPQQRDALLRRLEGICNGSIKPAVTPSVSWAIESGRIVLAVNVPKGSEPIYYSQGKPYLRHITTSRPAEPHEVVDLLRRYLASRLEFDGSDQSEESAFYSDLASILVSILLWGDTPARERHVNPWLEEWRADSKYAASVLRELAARDVAVRRRLVGRLHEVADAVNEVATFRMSLGCGDRLEAVATSVTELSAALKRETVDAIPLRAAFVAKAKAVVKETSRKLNDLADRAQQIVSSGNVEELQSKVGTMGTQLVQLSFYDLSSLGPEMSRRLRQVGMSMRLVKATRIYIDGGASMKHIIGTVAECAAEMEALARDKDS